MRIRASIDGLDAALRSESQRVFSVVDEGMKEGAEGLKNDLREETASVLGRRVAFAWRSRFYANPGDTRGPAGFVWSKAARIIDFHSAERVHTPIGAAFAIPVNPVVKRGGRAMSIAEVESRFNQDLIPRRLPSGNIGLFADLVRARSGRRPGFRQATKGRIAAGRKPQLTLMFVLVRHLRSHKLIDLQGAAQRWGARTAADINRRLGLGSADQ